MQDRQNQINSAEYIEANPQFFTTRVSEAAQNVLSKEPIGAMYNGKKVYHKNKQVFLRMTHPHIIEITPYVYRYRPDLNTDIEAKTYVALQMQRNRILSDYPKQIYRLDTTPPTLLVDGAGNPILFDKNDTRFTREKNQRFFQLGDKKIAVVKRGTYESQQVKAKKNKIQNKLGEIQTKRAKVENSNSPASVFPAPPQIPVNKMSLNFLIHSESNTKETGVSNQPDDTNSNDNLVRKFLQNPAETLGRFYQPIAVIRKPQNEVQDNAQAQLTLKK